MAQPRSQPRPLSKRREITIPSTRPTDTLKLPIASRGGGGRHTHTHNHMAIKSRSPGAFDQTSHIFNGSVIWGTLGLDLKSLTRLLILTTIKSPHIGHWAPVVHLSTTLVAYFSFIHFLNFHCIIFFWFEIVVWGGIFFSAGQPKAIMKKVTHAPHYTRRLEKNYNSVPSCLLGESCRRNPNRKSNFSFLHFFFSFI